MTGKKIAFPGPFLLAAAAMIVSGGLISAINSAAPFERGSWLVAYLVLVGGVAQAALAYGREATGTTPLSRPETLRLLAFWNCGSLVVPLGVLADVGLFIGIGSAALLAALWLYSRDLLGASQGSDSRRSRPPVAAIVGYLGFAALLAVSIAIGCLLADAPLLGTI